MKHSASWRMAAFGAVTAMAIASLVGCSSNDGSSGTVAKGTTITYSLQAFTFDAIKPIVADFTKKTGIKVKLESGPSSGQDLLTQLVPSFTAGTSPYDVIDADDPSTAALAAGGWLQALPDTVTSAYEKDLSKSMVASQKQWNVKDGKTYRLYHNWDIGYTWANEALLKAHGLEVPKTWDDLKTVGAALKSDGIYAFGDAVSKPGLTFVYLSELAAQAGGNIYKADAGTKTAFEFAKELIDDGYFPKDALTWTYDQSNAAYMADKLATMRQWSFFADVAKGNTAWYSPDKAVVVAPAAGPAGAKTWAGGWGMAIPKASKHVAAAEEFVKYMNSPAIAVKLAKASSFFVTARTSVLNELGTSGIAASLKEYSDKGYVTPRPFIPQAAQGESIVDDIGQSYLTGQITIDQAMTQLKTQISALG